jgi:hypothetical protein
MVKSDQTSIFSSNCSKLTCLVRITIPAVIVDAGGIPSRRVEAFAAKTGLPGNDAVGRNTGLMKSQFAIQFCDQFRQ